MEYLLRGNHLEKRCLQIVIKEKDVGTTCVLYKNKRLNTRVIA